jgi:hypothetical protein
MVAELRLKRKKVNLHVLFLPKRSLSVCKVRRSPAYSIMERPNGSGFLAGFVKWEELQ